MVRDDASLRRHDRLEVTVDKRLSQDDPEQLRDGQVASCDEIANEKVQDEDARDAEASSVRTAKVGEVDVVDVTRPSHVMDDLFSDDVDTDNGIYDHDRGYQHVSLGLLEYAEVISRRRGEDNGEDGTRLGVQL